MNLRIEMEKLGHKIPMKEKEFDYPGCSKCGAWFRYQLDGIILIALPGVFGWKEPVRCEEVIIQGIIE